MRMERLGTASTIPVVGRGEPLLSRCIYEQTDDLGRPTFAGIRYESRLNAEWECWAIFHDRMDGRHSPGFPETITPDHPALCEVAAQYHLSIEIFQGAGHFVRP